MDAETRERNLALAFAQRVPEWQDLLKATIGNVHYDHAFDKEVRKLSASRDVFGLCLSTDIKDYTVIARRHSAHQLMELLQHYYQLLASPVRSGKGIIANVIGDSMMALWIDAPAEQLRNAACIAALEIQLAVARFNASSTIEPLYTRIGIHEGDMTLGKLVLDNPGNLNPIGDAANTASRIEGVNKYLGTQILASAVIAPSLASILYRPVGKFYLVGRDEAIELVEVMALSTNNNPARALFLQEFAAGLNAFQQGAWQKAEDTFRNILNYYSHDGPSQFYLALAIQYQTNPPTGWEGIVRFEGK
jgi:adenylate cyclase